MERSAETRGPSESFAGPTQEVTRMMGWIFGKRKHSDLPGKGAELPAVRSDVDSGWV